METQIIIIHCPSRCPKYAEPGHFTLLFCRGQPRNVNKDFQRICITIVLRINPFVWGNSHCHCHCGLLKLPISCEGGGSEGSRWFLLAYDSSFCSMKGLGISLLLLKGMLHLTIYNRILGTFCKFLSLLLLHVDHVCTSEGLDQ